MEPGIQIAAAMIEVKKYCKPDGYATRYWAVYVDGELLAVTVYRKGAMAVADMLLEFRGKESTHDAA